MTPNQAAYLILQELKRRTETVGLDRFYPDDGPLRRDLYVKHIKALSAGKTHAERAIFGGNRVGKTEGVGGYEAALHATGLYPDWWDGYVIDKPAKIWAAGTKAVKVRDVNQKLLIGSLTKSTGFTQAQGGLIPAARIKRIARKTGVADAIDHVVVEHVRGWENVITFKSYEEGYMSFESEAVEFIWLDEEPDKKIYDSCLMRILTTKGRLLTTFTPLKGMTETVLSMLEEGDLL